MKLLIVTRKLGLTLKKKGPSWLEGTFDENEIWERPIHNFFFVLKRMVLFANEYG